jgi:hypothetical protein
MKYRTYYSPKIIALLLLLGLITAAVDPVMRRFLTRATATGLKARLTIDTCRVSLHSTDFELTGVRLAPTLDSQQDSLACESVVVDVEGAPLLRRKLVVRNATATGVQLLNECLDANEFSLRWPLPRHWNLHEPARKALQASLAKSVALARKNPLANSRAAALLVDLVAGSTQQTGELESALGICELRVERFATITKTLTSTTSVPDELEPLASAEQTSLELQRLAQRLDAFQNRVAQSRQQLDSDRQRLAALRNQDLSEAKETSHLQIPSAQILSEYFLGAEAAERSWQILRFVQWAQEFLPPTNPAPTPSAGFAIAFPERNPLPAFVLRALNFEGQGEVADRSFHFAGTLQNFSNDPQCLGHPTRLVLDAKVPHRVVIEAAIDRTSDLPRERVVIRCPSWPQSQQTFGDPTVLGILAQPCLLGLRAELDLSGERVSGIVQMRQQKLRLTSTVASELGGQRVRDALSEMLSQIDTIDYEVKVNGPLDSPSLALTSNWGERVAGGLQHAFEREQTLRTAELAQQLSDTLDRRIAAWEQTSRSAQQKLQDRLATAQAQLQALDTAMQRHLAQAQASHPQVTRRPSSPPDRTLD